MGLMSSDNIKEEITMISYVTTILQEESSVMETCGCCEELVFSGSLYNSSEIMHFERLIKTTYLNQKHDNMRKSYNRTTSWCVFFSFGTSVMSRSLVLISVMDMTVKRMKVFGTGY
jgi:hypothetical protein